MFGKITLGDNMMIGAGAIVNKSFEKGNCTIAGNPAIRVSDHGNVGGLENNIEIWKMKYER